jgi:3-hydroxyisobutyrate dehydrogenase-like beta-hydroxyacid dehydrogenase
MKVGLLHPGEMGSALGAALADAGHEVLWASAGRSEATRTRAVGFRDVGTIPAIASEAEVVLSVVPPHAALDVARALPPFDGVYVDANAVAPATAHAVGDVVGRFVDGGIVGGPQAPRLYLAGDDAAAVAALFAGSAVATEIVANASALKCAYAAWTKGTAALLLAIQAFARAEGVEDALLAEWARSQPELTERLEAAARSAERKGWRWVGEMEEIAAAFAADGLPRGFHEAAAAVYRDSIGLPTVSDSRSRGSSSA